MTRARTAITSAAVVAVAVLASSAACTTVEDPTASTEPGAAETTAPIVQSTTAPPPVADLGAVAIGVEEIATLDQPTALTTRAGDPGLYVTERAGRVRRIDVTVRRGSPAYQLENGAVLDLGGDVLSEGQEQGLLGLAFSTDGSRLYIAYTGPDADQRLDEVEMSGNRAVAGSRRTVLVVPDFAANHNGGQLAFGPDGFLYWGMGDGGGVGDPEGTGQVADDLLGSILRIDTDVAPEAGGDYAIPNGNPFAEGGGAPEVWAYGLRNPWRFSFDAGTGDLWIADVGQGDVEEIDLLPAEASGTNAGRGANLGWSALEGDRPFDDGEAPTGAIGPVFTYGHDGGGCSVTGGHVYRGAAVPALVGAYVYADFCIGDVRGLVVRDGEVVDERSLGVEVASPSSFGVDGDGELYVLSLGGAVLRVVPA
jgi:glucose/arabinose dehydrogenase